MSAKKLLALWGLKWNPFPPELPGDALLVTGRIENFAWRVEQLVQEGGFALISGESGTGKSVALRIVAQRLATLRDVVVSALFTDEGKGGVRVSLRSKPPGPSVPDVNVARLAGVHPTRALERSAAKFASRFRAVLEMAESEDLDPREASLEELDELWERVKASGISRP